MTHRVPVDLVGDYITTGWYINSMEPIKGMVRSGAIGMQMLFDAYQMVHGVRMLWDQQGWITHIEFSSEEEAVEFVLKWS